jgi:hypothetical protein
MDQNQIHAFQSMLVFLPFLGLACVILLLIPYWFIWKKAGFSPWFSLLMLIPLVNLIMLYVLAFSEWKVVPAAQSAANFSYQYPPSPPPPPRSEAP